MATMRTLAALGFVLVACGGPAPVSDAGADVSVDTVTDAPAPLSPAEQALVGTWQVRRQLTLQADLRLTLEFRADHTMTSTLELMPPCGVSTVGTITRTWTATDTLIRLAAAQGCRLAPPPPTCPDPNGSTDFCGGYIDPMSSPYTIMGTTLAITGGGFTDNYQRQ